MARQYHIHGETMVYVKGGAHLSLLEGSPMTSRTELGLSTEQIIITPSYKKKDMIIDNYGPDVPIDVVAYMSECTIEMSLVHFDASILNICLGESNGGLMMDNLLFDANDEPFRTANVGKAGKAGSLLGKGYDYFASGNNFISLTLKSVQPIPLGGTTIRFKTSYISDRVVYPLGTKYTAVDLTWRAIPYVPFYSQEISGGLRFFDHSSVSGFIFDNVLDT